MAKKKIKRFEEGGETGGSPDSVLFQKYRDSINSSPDSDVLEKARSSTDQRGQRVEFRPDGTGRFPVMDVSKVQDDMRVAPRWAHADKNFQGAGARVIGTKKIGKDAMLQGYLDADVMRDKYQGTKGNFSGAGVNFVKNFAGGGKVVAASKRADGIAQRGKTRGKIV